MLYLSVHVPQVRTDVIVQQTDARVMARVQNLLPFKEIHTVVLLSPFYYDKSQWNDVVQVDS